MENPDANSTPRHARGLRVLDGGPSTPGAVRPLPHSAEAEEHLLGCCLLDGAHTLERCAKAGLRPEHFHLPANRVLYEQMTLLLARQGFVDIAILAEELKTTGRLEAIGGFDHLAQVSGRIPTTAQAGYFLDKVLELAILRRLIRDCTEAVESAFNYQGGLEAFTGGIAARMAAIADWVQQRQRRITQREAAGLARTEAREVAEGRVDKSRWLHWPWPRMDEGFLPIDTRQEDWLNLVAAPPSGGKSAYLRALAAHWLLAGKRGVVFLLETSRKRWLQALAAMLAGVNLRELESTRQLFPEKLAAFDARMAELEGWMEERLWVYDDLVALEDVQRTCRTLHRAEREKELAAGVPEEQAQGLHFIIGDYLQILTTRKTFYKRTEELAHVCRSLKQLHRGLDVPGFWGAQITRESRAEARPPTLADLSESKALEETADRVQFIHTVPDENGQPPPGDQRVIAVEIYQRKSRNGPKDVRTPLEFVRHLGQFQAGNAKAPVAAPAAGVKALPKGAKVDKSKFLQADEPF